MHLIGKPAKGIVLEAPFFSIVEEVELHPFTWVNHTLRDQNRIENHVSVIFFYF